MKRKPIFLLECVGACCTSSGIIRHTSHNGGCRSKRSNKNRRKTKERQKDKRTTKKTEKTTDKT